jgi:hypothetical protein
MRTFHHSPYFSDVNAPECFKIVSTQAALCVSVYILPCVTGTLMLCGLINLMDWGGDICTQGKHLSFNCSHIL